MALKLTLAWALMLLVLAIVGAATMFGTLRARTPAPRGLLLLLPFAGAAMLWAMWLNIADAPFEEWNSARVAPVVAWGTGLPLYYPPGEGPGTAFIYPPISAILRLPVTFSSNPTTAIIASAALNALLYHVPLILFIWSIRGSWLMRFIALLVVWGFSLDLRSLNYSAYWVHADAPALGFGLVACTILMRRGNAGRSIGRLVLASVFIALAIGSKQTMAPLLVALPFYVVLRQGWRAAIILAGMTAALLAAGFLACVGIWGYDAVMFNWFGIAGGQPWQFQDHGRVVSFLIWSGTFINEATGPAVAMALLYFLQMPVSKPHRPRGWIIRQPWFFPLMIAIIMVPLAIMSIAKRGGWGNSLSVTNYFLVAAIGAMIAGFRLRRNRPFARVVVASAALMAIALAAWSITPFTTVRSTLIELAKLDRNPEQTAFEFSRRHAGHVYFPRNPLATLMAEGRYYMFEFGLLDEMALGDKFRPSEERMRRNLPVNMQMIAIPPLRTAGIAQMQMPGFTEQYDEPELPGWIVFVKPRPK